MYICVSFFLLVWYALSSIRRCRSENLANNKAMFVCKDYACEMNVTFNYIYVIFLTFYCISLLFLLQFRSAIQLQFDFHRAIYNLGTVLVSTITFYSHQCWSITIVNDLQRVQLDISTKILAVLIRQVIMKPYEILNLHKP